MNESLPALVRERLGVNKLDPDELLDSRSWSDIGNAVASSYTLWSDSFTELPDKPANILRPLVAPTSFSSFNEIFVCLRALLLCQQVAIVLPDTMGYLARLFSLLTLLEPFIDSELVILLPEGDFPRDYLRSLNTARGQTRRPPPPGTALSQAEKIAIAEDISSDYEVGMALDYCRTYPSALDIACLNSIHREKLRGLLDSSAGPIPKRLLQGNDHLTYLPDLLSLDVPRLRVSLADLLAIHQYGLFDHWKRALENGLAQIGQMDEAVLLDPSSARLRTVRDELDEAARTTKSEVSRSSFLRTAQMGTTKFGVAAAAGALGALGGPMGAAIAGGASYLATVLIDWLGGRPNKGERAFRRMVVNFSPESIND